MTWYMRPGVLVTSCHTSCHLLESELEIPHEDIAVFIGHLRRCLVRWAQAGRGSSPHISVRLADCGVAATDESSDATSPDDGTDMSRRTVGAFLSLLLALIILGSLPGPSAEAGARRATPVGATRSRERLLAVAAKAPYASRLEPREDGREVASANGPRDNRSQAASAIPPLDDGESLLVALERSVAVTSRPGGGRTPAEMPVTSRYYAEPLVAWVQRVSSDDRFGLVSIPYVGGSPTGWITLGGLELSTTDVAVEVDLSSHELVVRRDGDAILRASAATGVASSPTPTGRYFVTDRVAFPRGGVLGTFAFGISGIQPHLPAGWNGGDQLAIHGTDDPSSIGTSASAGCVRVSERVLERLHPLLRLGTPVVIVA
jgi:hypothetical protein